MIVEVPLQLEEGDALRLNESFYNVEEIENHPTSKGKEITLNGNSQRRIVDEEELQTLISHTKMVKVIRSNGDTVISASSIRFTDYEVDL